MPFLAKRHASLVICVALSCAVEAARVCGDLSATRGPALTFNRTNSAPAELGSGPVSPRLLAPSRQPQSHTLHPAVPTARDTVAVVARWARVAPASTCVPTSLAIRARAARGPPRNVLS